jgi:hypothetical protein
VEHRPEDRKRRDGEFGQDQHDDDGFQPQRAGGVLQIDEGVGGTGDDRELAVQRLGAFHQLIFVLQPAVEAFQVRTIPKDVWLLAHRHPP